MRATLCPQAIAQRHHGRRASVPPPRSGATHCRSTRRHQHGATTMCRTSWAINRFTLGIANALATGSSWWSTRSPRGPARLARCRRGAAVRSGFRSLGFGGRVIRERAGRRVGCPWSVRTRYPPPLDHPDQRQRRRPRRRRRVRHAASADGAASESLRTDWVACLALAWVAMPVILLNFTSSHSCPPPPRGTAAPRWNSIVLRTSVRSPISRPIVPADSASQDLAIRCGVLRLTS